MAKWCIKEKVDAQLLAFWSKQMKQDAMLPVLFARRSLKSIEEASHHLNPALHQLYDPFLMKDMEPAAYRLKQAIEQKQRILVYGDYDVDGTTSVAMMVSFLTGMGLDVEFYIPDRFTEGYGLSDKGVDHAIEQNFDLMITLDCGIKSIGLVQRLTDHGIDVIICDHHTPGELLPPALAVLDPKRLDCEYPFNGLSGCGVGFKLIQAVCTLLDLQDEHWIAFLDLVTVSIACDLVPLTDENRILALYGLRTINEGQCRPGLKTLMGMGRDDQKKDWTISDLVFNVGPKINAAGRMKHAKTAVSLLLSNQSIEAKNYAKMLDDYNSLRKTADIDTTTEALNMLKEIPDQQKRNSQVVYAPHWPKGVVGIVASRLIEHHYKPTVVLTKHDGKITGSARSVEGFDLYEALMDCTEHMVQFGGHAFAAGMTLREEQLKTFTDAFEKAVSKRIQTWQKEERLYYDAEIRFSDIEPYKLNRLEKLGPFGPDNLRPVFLSKELLYEGHIRTMGQNAEHLQMAVIQRGSPTLFQATAFKLGHWFEYINDGNAFEMIYTIERQEFNGRRRTVLNVKDIRKYED